MKSSDRLIPRPPAQKRRRQLAIRVWQSAKSAWKIFAAMLREIFDESAYDRFLQQRQAVRSRETYRAFLRHSEAAAMKKPRCC